MKIVLDANIFVSSYINNGNPRKIVNRAADGKDMLFVTDEILAELKNTFGKRKFHLTEDVIKYRVDSIKKMGTKITVADSERITAGGSRDKTDNKFLECAIAANADYIISGDIHLLEMKKFRGVKIVNAAEYLEIVSAR